MKSRACQFVVLLLSAAAAAGEGINNSDVDLFEFEGKTYVFYATGDQATWGTVRVAMYSGPMKQFFQAYFPADSRTIKLTTKPSVRGGPG